MTTATAQMTAEQAKSFATFSVANAVHVKVSLKCGCKPYEDVFTYRRWLAQGYQVQRGEKAIKLPVIVHKAINVEQGGEEVEKVLRMFRTAAVFCRHQVKEVER